MSTNVLLVTIDSLRFDHTPFDGFASEHPSILSELAAEGLSFEAAYATGPGTSPSFPALICGSLPLSYGGLGPLSDERPRLSTHLGNAGLETGGFLCNPFLSESFHYDRGFDRFEDYQNPLMGIATRIFPRGIEVNNPKLRRIDDRLHVTDAIKKSYQFLTGKPRPYVSAEVVTDDAIDWLEDRERFFCWAHYMDVHHPCFPPERYRNRFDAGTVTQTAVAEWYSALINDPESLSASELRTMKQLYSAAIAYTDDQVRRLIDHLRATDSLEDTLVIVTSDHGELFGEHGQYGKPERMYDELLRVPLIVLNGPDYLEDATDDLVSLVDVPPLIHDALGLAIPDAYEGRVPGTSGTRDLVMAEHEVDGDVIVGARSNEWLYEADEIADEHRLYDLRDGGFTSVDPEGSGGRRVRRAVLERLSDLDVEARHLQTEVDGDLETRLEDLGYL